MFEEILQQNGKRGKKKHLFCVKRLSVYTSERLLREHLEQQSPTLGPWIGTGSSAIQYRAAQSTECIIITPFKIQWIVSFIIWVWSILLTLLHYHYA